MLQHFEMSPELLMNATYKMLELKLVELKSANKYIMMSDLIGYLMNVILINKKISNIDEAAYYVFNIKINRLIEYMNHEVISRKDIDLLEFQDMFKK